VKSDPSVSRIFCAWFLTKCIYKITMIFIREKNSRVQRTKFFESHSYFGDALGPIVENKNESREKWLSCYFILFRKYTTWPDFILLKNTVTYVTVQNSLSRGTLALTVRITPRGLWEINITKKVRGNKIQYKKQTIMCWWVKNTYTLPLP
jgi:hypothetical protein